MYDNILFPTDGSDPTESVLEYASRIASEHEATIHVLHVVDTARSEVISTHGDVVDALEDEGNRIVEDASRQVRDHGVSVVSEVRRGDPYRTIVDYSHQSGVDCIVMPTYGQRGVQRYLIGSVTERVINTAEVPVIAVNPDRDRSLRYPPRCVLVPIDGSRGAELALTEGIGVAKATGATLHLLHVVETDSLGSDAQSVLQGGQLTEGAKDLMDEATEKTEQTALETVTRVVKHREPTKAILDYIEENEIDLTVMGTHGQTDFSRYVMGGVSAKLVRTSPVPVIWVREPESDVTVD